MKRSQGRDDVFAACARCIFFETLWPLALLLPSIAAAQTAVVSGTPDADAFVRSASPASNYGSAGGLSVSGSSAVNGMGQQNGLFDTLMRFPTSNVVATLDTALGPSNLVITGARLIVSEMASPDNAIFNRGVGAFEVLWSASNTWVEGTGTPKTPTTDGVTWNDLSGIVNSNLDMSLGIFTNAGANGQIAFSMALATPLVEEIHQGKEVGLHLTAADAGVGFTFNSRDFGNTNARPLLEITAAVKTIPRIDGIALSNGCVFVSFGTVSNWTCRLQGADTLPGGWQDLLVVPSQSEAGAVQYRDWVTNQQRFYRLCVSP